MEAANKHLVSLRVTNKRFVSPLRMWRTHTGPDGFAKKIKNDQ